MPIGKLASQAGHAFLQAYLNADPQTQQEYHGDGVGTKVVLKAKNLSQLLKAYDMAQAAGVPCSLIEDQGHVLPPHFNGNPIVTALGIGPATRDAVSRFTKRFNLI